MLLRDQVLMVASILCDGNASRYDQRHASRVLSRVAHDIAHMEQLLDGIVADAQCEEHLLAVSERRSQIRLVR
jgi:hypothetical protein